MLWATCSLLLLRATAQPEERIRWLRKFDEAIARFVGGNVNCWACSRHWVRATREANEHCSSPLSQHSNELSRRNIPRRFYDLFDRIGAYVPNYRPGTRWCNKCATIADTVFSEEQDYIPPAKVCIMFPLVHNLFQLKKYMKCLCKMDSRRLKIATQ